MVNLGISTSELFGALVKTSSPTPRISGMESSHPSKEFSCTLEFTNNISEPSIYPIESFKHHILSFLSLDPAFKIYLYSFIFSFNLLIRLIFHFVNKVPRFMNLIFMWNSSDTWRQVLESSHITF